MFCPFTGSDFLVPKFVWAGAVRSAGNGDRSGGI